MKNFFMNNFSRSNKKKKVAFKSKPVVHIIPEDEQETPVEELWYRSEDSQKILSENKRLIRLRAKTNNIVMEDDILLLDGHNGDDNNAHCFRGLESIDSEGKRRAREFRMESFAVVFSCQQVQMMQGSSNPESIAKAYGRSCEQAVQHAQKLALKDDMFVRTFIRGTTDKYNVHKVDQMSDDRTVSTVSADDDSLFDDVAGDDLTTCSSIQGHAIIVE